jgi:hypothetical protein
MTTRLCFVAALLLVSTSGCRAEEGACPSASECACPCSNDSEPVCAASGRVYQNACMLECDGASEAACLEVTGTDADCAQQCEGAGGGEECGSTTDANGDEVFTLYPSACHRDCAGARPERRNQC